MLETEISDRYSKETESINLGFANLWPYLNISKGESILDLGCGNGGQTARFADAVGESGFVAGIDLTKAMIEKAINRVYLCSVDFRIGDIHNLPYQNDVFDKVISNCVINHSMDKSKVYTEIFRVLRTGGSFIIGDVTAQERLPDFISADQNAVSACWGGAIPKHDYLGIIAGCCFRNVEILQGRCYYKNGYGLESVVIRGEKP